MTQLRGLLKIGPTLALLLLRKHVIRVYTCFNFSFVEKEEILKEIKNLKANNATQNTEIPINLNEENLDSFVDFIFENLNNSNSQSVFPSALKLENITPEHKKDWKSKKDHHQPIIVLPNISKTCESFFFKQNSEYFKQFLSKYQCGFRKGFSAQHSLLSMLEKWISAVDNKKVLSSWIFPRRLTVSN